MEISFPYGFTIWSVNHGYSWKVQNHMETSWKSGSGICVSVWNDRSEMNVAGEMKQKYVYGDVFRHFNVPYELSAEPPHFRIDESARGLSIKAEPY